MIGLRCNDELLNTSPFTGRRGLWLCCTQVLLLIGATLLVAAGLVQAASSFSVGSFVKTSAAAPTSQVVAHGLGETPKALIFWTAGSTFTSFNASHRFSFGMTDGSTS